MNRTQHIKEISSVVREYRYTIYLSLFITGTNGNQAKVFANIRGDRPFVYDTPSHNEDWMNEVRVEKKEKNEMRVVCGGLSWTIFFYKTEDREVDPAYGDGDRIVTMEIVGTNDDRRFAWKVIHSEYWSLPFSQSLYEELALYMVWLTCYLFGLLE